MEIFDLQQWLFENLFQPIMLWLDMVNYLDSGYMAAGWFLWGCIQIALIAFIISPIERLRPVEAVTDRRAVYVDVIYTVLHRLGIFRLMMFFLFTPIWEGLFSVLRSDALGGIGLGTTQIDQILPNITDIPWVSFLIYLIAFDFLDYWIHRAQHAFRFWWALHSLHHAQQQMTCWSDSRNHLLDDVLRDVVVTCTAFLIGVSPAQFIGLVFFAQLFENLQHANLRLSFGRWGECLLISPRFHRLHHSKLHGFGHNFGVLFPWWDIFFGTACFKNCYAPTGAQDQSKVNYGRGFWAQQWLGLVRFIRVWF